TRRSSDLRAKINNKANTIFTIFNPSDGSAVSSNNVLDEFFVSSSSVSKSFVSSIQSSSSFKQSDTGLSAAKIEAGCKTTTKVRTSIPTIHFLYILFTLFKPVLLILPQLLCQLETVYQSTL